MFASMPTFAPEAEDFCRYFALCAIPERYPQECTGLATKLLPFWSMAGMKQRDVDGGVRAKKELTPAEVLFGASPRGRDLQRRLAAAAESDSPVLLEGESGVGKEAAARWLHVESSYADAPFVKLICRGDLYQEQCKAGAEDTWSFAHLLHEGAATLFFEEVENLGNRARLQLKDLLEQRRTSAGIVNRQGDALADLRVVWSTRQTLDAAVTAQMAGALAGRLVSVRVLPLRERREDLGRLASHFIAVEAARFGLERGDLSAQTMNAIERYRWPGNLRELDEMMTSYVLTGDEGLLREKIEALRRSTDSHGSNEIWLDPPPGLEGLVVPKTAPGPTQFAMEDEMILRALRENCWNRRQTANRLQMSYRSLLNRLKKIDVERRARKLGMATSRG